MPASSKIMFMTLDRKVVFIGSQMIGEARPMQGDCVGVSVSYQTNEIWFVTSGDWEKDRRVAEKLQNLGHHSIIMGSQEAMNTSIASYQRHHNPYVASMPVQLLDYIRV